MGEAAEYSGWFETGLYIKRIGPQNGGARESGFTEKPRERQKYPIQVSLK